MNDANEKIDALMNEAIRAGDLDMAAVCEVALGLRDASTTPYTRAEARAECRRVMAECAGCQDDEPFSPLGHHH